MVTTYTPGYWQDPDTIKNMEEAKEQKIKIKLNYM